MYRIKAHRSSSSAFGGAVAFLKQNGVVRTFEKRHEAQAEADRLNSTRYSDNVWYEVE